MKRAGALTVECRKRKGRHRLRWENSVLRDLAAVGGEWSMRPRDRRKWGRLAETKRNGTSDEEEYLPLLFGQFLVPF